MAPSEVWSNKVDFYMAALSYAVGFSCLWRFPYLCYLNGGGAFLIPFILVSIVIGFPLVTLELTIGQFGRRGPLKVWNLCPLFEGVGWSMLVVSLVTSGYLAMVIGYGMYYVAVSFGGTMPWTTCDNEWNTNLCMDAEAACIRSRMIWQNNSCVSKPPDYNLYVPEDQDTSEPLPGRHPSEEYFYNAVLMISEGIEELGSIRWSLALCLLVTWAFITLALCLGQKSWGKFCYVTAILPFILLLALLIQASQMPGARDGILYAFVPNWRKLTELRVWADAAIQVLFSLGVGMGSYITLGRFNRFNDNPIVDAGVIVLANVCASIFCVFVVFTLVGQFAHTQAESVSGVLEPGFGLAFIALPVTVSTLPQPQVWSVLLFLMLICLGLGSVIPAVANILVSLTEVFPKLNSKLYRFFVLLGLVGVSFLGGLFYATNGGLYRLVLVDNYGATYGLPFLALLQVVVVSWVYGSWRLVRDLAVMTHWWRCFLCFGFWNILSPVVILLVLIYMMVTWSPICMKEYCFPTWTNVIGWLLVVSEIIFVPIYLIFVLVTYGTGHRIHQSVRPTQEWGKEPGNPDNAGLIQPTTESKV